MEVGGIGLKRRRVRRIWVVGQGSERLKVKVDWSVFKREG